MALSLRTTPAEVHKEIGIDQSKESEEQSPIMSGCKWGMSSDLEGVLEEVILEDDRTERRADLLLLLCLPEAEETGGWRALT